MWKDTYWIEISVFRANKEPNLFVLKDDGIDANMAPGPALEGSKCTVM